MKHVLDIKQKVKDSKTSPISPIPFLLLFSYLYPFSTTKASVSLTAWQHLCLSINTQTKLWMFYKDGLMTDIGVADLSPFPADDRIADGYFIFLGQSSSSVSPTTPN